MAVHANNQRYHSYLLRLWPAGEPGKLVWRASLENPRTGERLAFASLERLFAFLQDQTAEVTWGSKDRRIDEDKSGTR